MKYDLWISVGRRELPDLQAWIVEIPALADPTRQTILRTPNFGYFGTGSPGFLGLDLSWEQALRLGRYLKQGGLGVMLAPAAYRQPRLTLPQAEAIATRYLADRVAADPHGDTFGPVGHLPARDHARWWTFARGSATLQDEGWVPGAYFAQVDKLDGHLWEDAEMEQLWREMVP